MTIYLTLEDVLEIHRRVIAETGGTAGIRDVKLLDSAVFRPQAGFAGIEFYATLAAKTAALLHSLIMNHPFLDGNKRVAFAAAEIFLNLNGWKFKATEDELFDFIISIAERKVIFRQMTPWVEMHIAKLIV